MQRIFLILSLIISAGWSAQAENACREDIEAYSFTATYLATSYRREDPLIDSGFGPFRAEVDLAIELPILASKYPYPGNAETSPSMRIEMKFEERSVYDTADSPTFVFSMNGPALEDMLSQSAGNRELTCRYRTEAGTTPTSEFVWNFGDGGSCAIDVDALFPPGVEQGTQFRFVLQSLEDGLTYVIADYPSGLPQEISSSIRTTAESLAFTAQHRRCRFGFARD